MPVKNTLKVFTERTHYHIYNHGLNKRRIFRDTDDYLYFEQLLSRSLMSEPVSDKQGRAYTWLREQCELNAYCLMPTQFHLLVFQYSDEGVTRLMRSVMTAYTMYFNKKYQRRGPLFESTYKAVRIAQGEQLLYATRYIHLNHRDFATWPHSSLQEYLHLQDRSWIQRAPILGLFTSSEAYADFMLDHESVMRERAQLKDSPAH